MIIVYILSSAQQKQSGGTPPATPPRMWTCTKCSYAYNPLWVELCDICESRRSPASLTQPSLITVTKDDPSNGKFCEVCTKMEKY